MNEEENSSPVKSILENEKYTLDNPEFEDKKNGNYYKESEINEFNDNSTPMSGRVSNIETSLNNSKFNYDFSKENINFGSDNPQNSSDNNETPIHRTEIYFTDSNNKENDEFDDFSGFDTFKSSSESITDNIEPPKTSDFDFSDFNKDNEEYEDFENDFDITQPTSGDIIKNNEDLKETNSGFQVVDDKDNDKFDDFDTFKSSSENTINNIEPTKTSDVEFPDFNKDNEEYDDFEDDFDSLKTTKNITTNESKETKNYNEEKPESNFDSSELLFDNNIINKNELSDFIKNDGEFTNFENDFGDFNLPKSNVEIEEHKEESLNQTKLDFTEFNNNKFAEFGDFDILKSTSESTTNNSELPKTSDSDFSDFNKDNEEYEDFENDFDITQPTSGDMVDNRNGLEETNSDFLDSNNKENDKFDDFDTFKSSSESITDNIELPKSSDFDFPDFNKDNEEYEDFENDFDITQPTSGDMVNNRNGLEETNSDFLDSNNKENDKFDDFSDFDTFKSSSESITDNIEPPKTSDFDFPDFNSNEEHNDFNISDSVFPSQKESFFDVQPKSDQSPNNEEQFNDFDDFGDFDSTGDNNFEFGDFDSAGDNNLSFEEFDNSKSTFGESSSFNSYNSQQDNFNYEQFIENVKKITSKLNELGIDDINNKDKTFNPTTESLSQNFMNKSPDMKYDDILSFNETIIGKSFISLLDKSNLSVPRRSVKIQKQKPKKIKQEDRKSVEMKPQNHNNEYDNVLKPQPLIPMKHNEEKIVKLQDKTLNEQKEVEHSKLQSSEVSIQLNAENKTVNITEEITNVNIVNNEVVTEEKLVEVTGLPTHDIDISLIDSISSGLITSFSDPSVEHSSISLFDDTFFSKEETNVSSHIDSNEKNRLQTSSLSFSDVNLNIIPPTSYSSNLTFEVLFPSNKNETNEPAQENTQNTNELFNFNYLKDKNNSSTEKEEIKDEQKDTIQELNLPSSPIEKDSNTNTESTPVFSAFENSEPIGTNFAMDFSFNFNSDFTLSNTNSTFDTSLLYSLNPIVNLGTDQNDSNEETNKLFEEIINMIPDISYLTSFTLNNSSTLG